jgi:hypothetical protein
VGSEINLEGKIEGGTGSKIKNSSEFHHITKGILWNREIPKQCKTGIYKLYFKPVLMQRHGPLQTEPKAQFKK